MVQPGDEAPDFTLPGIDRGQEGTWTLSSLRGHPVVVAFYPGDGTPVCTTQLNAYTEDFERFDEIDAQLLAISPQSVASHRAFAEEQGGFAFPLLADEDKAVAERYGTLGPLGFYRRAVVVIDATGRVVWSHRSVAGLTFRPVDRIIEALRTGR